MNQKYEPILNELMYWYHYDYENHSKTYRKTHDRDCLLTGGNLCADTVISLWLPLRYVIMNENSKRWQQITNKSNLKKNKEFLLDLIDHIEVYIPEDSPYLDALSYLFTLGQTRANVMILLDPSWNTDKGSGPYYDYLPHYLYDLMEDDSGEIKSWIKDEHLTGFFQNEIVRKDHILDLAGTGSVTLHYPSIIHLDVLLGNYIRILEDRSQYYIPAVKFEAVEANMNGFRLDQENIEMILSFAILQRKYLTFCKIMLENNICQIVPQEVVHYEICGKFQRAYENPVFMMFDVKQAMYGKHALELHEKTMEPIFNGGRLMKQIQRLCQEYDFVFTDERLISPEGVYGGIRNGGV